MLVYTVNLDKMPVALVMFLVLSVFMSRGLKAAGIRCFTQLVFFLAPVIDISG